MFLDTGEAHKAQDIIEELTNRRLTVKLHEDYDYNIQERIAMIERDLSEHWKVIELTQKKQMLQAVYVLSEEEVSG